MNRFELELNVNGTKSLFENKNLNLSKGQSIKFTLPEATLVDGNNLISAKITTINGKSSDQEECNNVVNFAQKAVTAAPNRSVLIEEGTGPWCQWCPRGAVFMDWYDDLYHKLFIPIAVHNGGTNPMKIAEYDNFMDFAGFPNCKVNRNDILDPCRSEVPFLREIAVAPKLNMEIDPVAGLPGADSTLRTVLGLISFARSDSLGRRLVARDDPSARILAGPEGEGIELV